MNKNTILYVDDDERNLSSFKAVFRRDYHILIANSALDGYQLLKENDVKIIVSDQRMPDVSGVEFLEKTSQEYPDVVRIILTGYSDYDAILDSINKANVYRFIPKPWKKTEFKQLIDGAFELYDLRKHNFELTESLVKTNNELDQFIYSASHDLKAPISTLKGLVYLAKQENEISILKGFIDKKEKTILRLEQFIGEINQYSRNLRRNVERDLIDFNELIHEVIADLDNHENIANSSFIINVENQIGFYSDRTRLRDVLFNLLLNAVTFYQTPVLTNEIHIDVFVDSAQMKLTIRDSGIGIPTDIIDRIFDMFFKSDTGRHGSGLGLYIARQSVIKLNGSIKVSSELNQGSTFEVNIPQNFV
ncbi:MAG: hybrid sensor histidine kinase/response regulator [Cytophagales bacterium]